MNLISIVFFGSFQSYSAQVLGKLINNFSVIAVVTTPPKPAGRHLVLTPTSVHQFAKKKNIPVFPLESLTTIPKELAAPDFIVVAGYGKLIPNQWLGFPKIMAVNMHPSLLPAYRGAFPAEWAILRGEKETGVTLVKMSSEFDKGEILAQKGISIGSDDTRETLYTKLYDLGGQLLVETLPAITKGKVVPAPQPPGDYFNARRLSREDGFVPWKEFEEALKTHPQTLDLKLRAFAGWPGVWSTTPGGKRLKLTQLRPTPLVQLEGKKPIPFPQLTPS